MYAALDDSPTFENEDEIRVPDSGTSHGLRLTGERVRDCVISVPSNFGIAQRQAIRKARGATPYSSTIAFIFATAAGVAPKPKPQCPPAITAAS